MKLSQQIDVSGLCSYALWEGVSNLENEVESLTKQRDELLAAKNLLLREMENIAAGLVKIPLREYAMHVLAGFDAAVAHVKGVSSSPVIEDESAVECDSCPNVTSGCLGKCMKSGVA